MKNMGEKIKKTDRGGSIRVVHHLTNRNSRKRESKKMEGRKYQRDKISLS